MLCEECGKNQATVTITLAAAGGAKTRRLCPECMKKMESSLAKGDIQSFLSSILAVLGTEKKQETPDLTCASCGHTYAEFEHTGRLGCAQCYRAFSEQLKPMLQRIHGRAQHAGRRPASFVPDPRDVLNEQIADLRRRMDEAVACEDFEEAARCRDELRSLMETSEEVRG